ncbi:hypothetical protein KGF56_003571 [Candida oxycetoniae]|uniref:Glutathione peroxidase n=1 Tax=Candida oxycetoniae TaxID=497107 RepID=A0AAI9SVS9_9ASCO|nr:uncharacterized protein KGF56_003571 [Candida oxycetoniae]KAI3403644.1 hypothetical protein KGF56_003571 [Candida oxycetoniae]
MTELNRLLTKTIYDFKLPNSSNEYIDFQTFKNKVLIIVNVASLCGYTPQYLELQQLYAKYHTRGLEILAFPCNQFGNQEPQTSKKIEQQCRRDFGVEFPIMKKCRVNGDDSIELYEFLKTSKPGLFGFRGIKWNFEKFVIDKKGNVVARFASSVTPLDFEDYIVQLLDKEEEEKIQS